MANPYEAPVLAQVAESQPAKNDWRGLFLTLFFVGLGLGFMWLFILTCFVIGIYSRISEELGKPLFH